MKNVIYLITWILILSHRGQHYISHHRLLYRFWLCVCYYGVCVRLQVWLPSFVMIEVLLCETDKRKTSLIGLKRVNCVLTNQMEMN